MRLVIIISMLMILGCDKSPGSCSNPWQSYYSPGKGTLNLHYGCFPGNARIIGEPLTGKLYVASDVGRTLLAITNDKTEVLFRGNAVTDLKEAYGQLLAIIPHSFLIVGTDDKITPVAQPGMQRCGSQDLFCTATSVVLTSGTEVAATNPRAALLDNNTLYVADTYGHKVTVWDATTGILQATHEVYYPNSLQLVGNSLIIASEHANQIQALDLTTGNRTRLYGCDLDVFNDPNASVADIRAAEASGQLRLPNGHSVCQSVLYSPNMGTLLPSGDLLIADTDNHRVLIVRPDGSIRTEVQNLNNPIKAVYIP